MKTKDKKQKRQKITQEKGFSLKDIIESYNQKETKGSIENSLLKGIVDSISGAVIGTSVAAASGKYSTLAGLTMIFLGRYFGDKTGLLGMAGAGTLGYGIAKAKEYQNESNADTLQKRMSGLKNDLLATAFLKWKKEENSKQENTKKPKPVSTTPSLSNNKEPEEKKQPKTKQMFKQKEGVNKNEKKISKTPSNRNLTEHPPNSAPDYLSNLPDLTLI